MEGESGWSSIAWLPHMGRVRSRSLVMEFLREAKELISNSANCSTIHKGIIAFGD